jgi:hypothetical protein
MTTTINASTSAGLVQTADTSGVLALQTANTTAVSINASQVVTLTNALPVTSGGTGVTTSTGTGANVLGTSPTITTPVISSLSSASATSLTLQSAGTTAVTIDTSQNVGIGTATPVVKLHVVRSDPTSILAESSGNTASYLGLKSTSGEAYVGTTSNGVVFLTSSSGTERMRLVSNGTLMVGTTSETPADAGTTKGIAFNLNGQSQIYATGNNDTCAVFNRAGSDGALIRTRRQGSDVGSISVTGSATAYNTSSDYRLKENITPMTGALAKVALLKPVTYKWKVDGSDGEGFIAHELAIVKPDCVSGDKDATREEQYEVTPAVEDEEGNITTPAVMGTRTVPVYQGVDTSFLVATLTAAIQELKAINDTQAETITTLAARITALEGN